LYPHFFGSIGLTRGTRRVSLVEQELIAHPQHQCLHYYGILLQVPVGYDISPLKRVKYKILTTSRQASG
jgi:hypothetical protein